MSEQPTADEGRAMWRALLEDPTSPDNQMALQWVIEGYVVNAITNRMETDEELALFLGRSIRKIKDAQRFVNNRSRRPRR